MINSRLHRVLRSATVITFQIQRPAPKIRTTDVSEKKTRKRKQSDNNQLNDGIPNKKVAFHDDILAENIDFDT